MDKEKSGLSIQTLAISACAAVAAAVIVPMFWERGTLLATAMTPVVVALVSEALKKPAQVVTAARPRAVTRRPRDGFEPLPEHEREAAPALRDDDPFGLRTVHRPARRRWKLALATGAVAFAVAVVGLTLSELVFGGPATREGGRTTFFPGGTRDRDGATPSPTATPSATEEATPEATETPAPTPSATEEATPEPTVTPTPTPTVTPAP